MVKISYPWSEGAEYKDHTQRKHKILREYLARYLDVRCQLPKRSRFRIAVVDGFAGGGRYACGSPGSPIIFIEEVRKAVEHFNLRRSAEGMSPLDIECLLILNDGDVETISLLRENIAPFEAAIKAEVPRLHLRVEFRNRTFEALYPEVKGLLEEGGYRNVLFCLDQCGHSHVFISTIRDIISSFPSAEVFYTFMIQSLLTFLAKDNPTTLSSQLKSLGVAAENLKPLENLMGKQEWLGTAERIVFDAFKDCAPFVSPFSINNPDGWRYWLIHFARSYRARQEYNNVLH